MVRIALLTLCALAATSASAAPMVASGIDSISLLRRADGQSNYTDADILNYALTLEHLEATFYAQALQNYSQSAFESAGFTNSTRAVVQALADQEATHVSTLTSALSAAGATPVEACNYTFPVSDVKAFLQLAAVIESVGVSAYLGAAPYISNPSYLSVAAAITTVEARHQAYLAYIDGEDPFPSPFDTAEGLRQVVTIASSFITSCPTGSAPSLKPFPALALAGNATAGSTISITPANGTSTGDNATLFCAFTSGIAGTNFTAYDASNHSCKVPADLVGQTYVVLTNANTTLTDDNTVAGPAILALGPASNFSAIVNSPSATSTNVPSASGTQTKKSAAGRATLSLSALLAASIAGAFALL